MRRTFLPFLALALSLAAPSQARALEIDVQVGSSIPTVSGSVTYTANGLAGSSIDLGTLGFGSGNDTHAKIDINHPIPVVPNIYVHYLPIDLVGNSTLTKAINFGGTTYAANANLRSEILIQQTDVGLYYNVPMLKTATAGMLNVKLGLNARIMNFNASITGTSGAVSKTTTASFAPTIPMAYLALDVRPIHLFSVNAEYKTLPMGSSSLVDWDVDLRIYPIPILYFGAGIGSYAITLDPSLAAGVPAANITFASTHFFLGADF
ncbi:MAG: hypothetical protein HY280_06800 [Nitrospinae bacterium]|nr:hypothetical protein [Nitrospinota bacterium]